LLLLLLLSLSLPYVKKSGKLFLGIFWATGIRYCK
jgi:hypothetical protein